MLSGLPLGLFEYEGLTTKKKAVSDDTAPTTLCKITQLVSIYT